MNLDELKTSWNDLDKKLQDSKQLSTQIVLTMIRQQSQGTVARMQNRLVRLIIFFSGLLMLFVAILAGNPFDFTHWAEFVPSALYALLVVVTLQMLIRHKLKLGKQVVANGNLREGIEGMIHLHQMWKVTMTRIWQISLLAGILLSISLLARNFGSYSLTKTLLIIFGMAATVAVLYFFTQLMLKKMPDRHLTELKLNLAELDEVVL